MTEYKSVIVVQTDESEQPTNLLSLEGTGDTISDEVLSEGVRGAVSGVSSVSSTVYDNSGTWDEVTSVSSTVFDNSGTWNEVIGVSSTVFDNSGTWDEVIGVSSTVFDNSGTWGTGGGSFTGSAVASGIAVLNTTNPNETSSLTLDVAVGPRHGGILVADLANETVKWDQLAFEVLSPGSVQIGTDLDRDATFVMEDINMSMDGGNITSTSGSVNARVVQAGLGGVSSLGPIIGYDSDTGVSTLGPILTDASANLSGLPYPPPVSYAQMNGAGTAATSEINFGAGVTPTEVSDPYGQITWNNTDKDWDLSEDGTYRVEATLSISTDTVTTVAIKIKNDTSIKNLYSAHGVHTAEDPEEVSIQAMFTAAAGSTISVTITSDNSANINLDRGSAVTITRVR